MATSQGADNDRVGIPGLLQWLVISLAVLGVVARFALKPGFPAAYRATWAIAPYIFLGLLLLALVTWPSTHLVGVFGGLVFLIAFVAIGRQVQQRNKIRTTALNTMKRLPTLVFSEEDARVNASALLRQLDSEDGQQCSDILGAIEAISTPRCGLDDETVLNLQGLERELQEAETTDRSATAAVTDAYDRLFLPSAGEASDVAALLLQTFEDGTAAAELSELIRVRSTRNAVAVSAFAAMSSGGSARSGASLQGLHQGLNERDVRKSAQKVQGIAGKYVHGIEEDLDAAIAWAHEAKSAPLPLAFRLVAGIAGERRARGFFATRGGGFFAALQLLDTWQSAKDDVVAAYLAAAGPAALSGPQPGASAKEALRQRIDELLARNAAGRAWAASASLAARSLHASALLVNDLGSAELLARLGDGVNEGRELAGMVGIKTQSSGSADTGDPGV